MQWSAVKHGWGTCSGACCSNTRHPPGACLLAGACSCVRCPVTSCCSCCSSAARRCGATARCSRRGWQAAAVESLAGEPALLPALVCASCARGWCLRRFSKGVLQWSQAVVTSSGHKQREGPVATLSQTCTWYWLQKAILTVLHHHTSHTAPACSRYTYWPDASYPSIACQHQHHAGPTCPSAAP